MQCVGFFHFTQRKAVFRAPYTRFVSLLFASIFLSLLLPFPVPL